MSAAGSVNGRLLIRGGKGWRGWKGWKGCLSCLSSPPLDPVLAHLPRQRIAVDAERVGGLRQTAFATAQDARDEALLELVNGVLELHAFVDHFLDEFLELVRDHNN